MYENIHWILDKIQNMGLNDVLDILIISVLIYQLLKFLSGTRGWQILIGLIFLLSIWLLAKILHLPTVLWIFDNIWPVALFLLIVVFQPELRRGLAKLGESGLFNFGLQSQKRVIDEVVRAITFLAERKIGALVVFERTVDLENYIEGCVKLNAEVNLELLITIFIPQTPLHDGAVIIKDRKIASAHCFLPLTINPNIPKYMGTRHRAAIGISEETDAIAVVVSEERGEISIAVDGKLIKNLDAISLKQNLTTLLGQQQSFTQKLKKKFKKKGKKT